MLHQDPGQQQHQRNHRRAGGQNTLQMELYNKPVHRNSGQAHPLGGPATNASMAQLGQAGGLQFYFDVHPGLCKMDRAMDPLVELMEVRIRCRSSVEPTSLSPSRMPPSVLGRYNIPGSEVNTTPVRSVNGVITFNTASVYQVHFETSVSNSAMGRS